MEEKSSLSYGGTAFISAQSRLKMGSNLRATIFLSNQLARSMREAFADCNSSSSDIRLEVSTVSVLKASVMSFKEEQKECC